MTDLLLYRDRQAEAMRELSRRARPGGMVINVDTDTQLHIPPSLEVVRYADVLGVEGQDEAGRASLTLARSWFRQGGSDPTTAAGLSFGRYMDYELKRVLGVACRHIAFLDAVRPTRLLLADDGSLITRASKAYASARGTPVELVPAAPVSEGMDFNLPAGAVRRRSAKERVQNVLCTLSWMSRHLGAADALTILVRPNWYTRSLIDAVLTRSAHRLVLPAFVRSHVGNPRIMMTDWQIASQPRDLAVSRERSWRAVERLVGDTPPVYRDVSMWTVIEPAARDFWANSWDAFYAQAHYYGRVFDALRPDAVVVPQDQAGFDKLLVMVANERGALSVCVTHGIESARPAGFPSSNADVIAVYGEECRRLCRQAGREVVAIGNDELGHVTDKVRSVDRSALQRRLGLDPARPVILFASGTYVNLWPAAAPSDANETLEAMCRAAAGLPRAQVLIRLHPSTHAYESVEVKREIVARLNPGNLVLDPGIGPYEALAVSDVVVTIDSTFGIEAIASGRPLVILDPKRTDIVGYVRGAAGPVAHDDEELRVVLDRIISEPRSERDAQEQGRRFLHERVTGLGDGNAGVRLLSEIEQRARGRQLREKKSA